MTRPRNSFQESERMTEQMRATFGEAGRWWESDPFARETDDDGLGRPR